MLRAVQHRCEDTQVDLAYVRARDRMVATRTKLINHVRGAVKSLGSRIPKCSAEVFHTRAITHVLSGLKPALKPVLQTIAGLTKTLRQYARTLLRQCEKRYPDTARLTCAGLSSIRPTQSAYSSMAESSCAASRATNRTDTAGKSVYYLAKRLPHRREGAMVSMVKDLGLI